MSDGRFIVGIDFEKWDTEIYGFFKLDPSDPIQVPMFDETVDRNWSPPDRDELVNYLRSAEVDFVKTGGVAPVPSLPNQRTTLGAPAE